VGFQAQTLIFGLIFTVLKTEAFIEIFQKDTCQYVSAYHGQQGGTINRKYCDEKFNWKLRDTKNNCRLVGWVEYGCDACSHNERDKPRNAYNHADNFDRKDRIFSKR